MQDYLIESDHMFPSVAKTSAIMNLLFLCQSEKIKLLVRDQAFEDDSNIQSEIILSYTNPIPYSYVCKNIYKLYLDRLCLVISPKDYASSDLYSNRGQILNVCIQVRHSTFI